MKIYNEKQQGFTKRKERNKWIRSLFQLVFLASVCFYGYTSFMK